jgi:hypothetical protein
MMLQRYKMVVESSTPCKDEKCVLSRIYRCHSRQTCQVMGPMPNGRTVDPDGTIYTIFSGGRENNAGPLLFGQLHILRVADTSTRQTVDWLQADDQVVVGAYGIRPPTKRRFSSLGGHRCGEEGQTSVALNKIIDKSAGR